jgi:hypothetical protein
LRWPKGSAGGNEQSNNEFPSPAHLVVLQERNINITDNEIKWQKQYEQKDKTAHFVSPHAWLGSAEDEEESHCDCQRSDNSNEDG